MCVANQVCVGSVRRAMTAVAVVGVLVASAGYGVAQTPAAGQPDIEQARRLVEEVFDYQGAVRSLDMAIAMWTASPDPDPDMLAQAYELRGRAHFALDDLDQTRRTSNCCFACGPTTSSPSISCRHLSSSSLTR